MAKKSRSLARERRHVRVRKACGWHYQPSALECVQEHLWDLCPDH